MTILLTNDDSIDAKGLKTLTEIALEFGKVIVVASSEVMSAQSHSITISSPLRLWNISKEDNLEVWCTNGTPVDCVKLAEKVILKGYPDLLLSGINHGSNASTNVLYSGTVSAAVEGAIAGYPAAAFSICDHSAVADFSQVKPYVREMIGEIIKFGMPKHTCLNINMPQFSDKPIKGIKVCGQGKGSWDEDFIERKDPFGKKYYWVTGSLINLDKDINTDLGAVEDNYIAIVPVKPDLTNYESINKLKKEYEKTF